MPTARSIVEWFAFACSDHAPNYSAMDDQARERAYLDAARQVHRSTRASRWF